jgi:hypothetical protein
MGRHCQLVGVVVVVEEREEAGGGSEEAKEALFVFIVPSISDAKTRWTSWDIANFHSTEILDTNKAS